LIEDNFDNSIDVLFKNFEYGEFIINNKSRKYLKNVNADQGVTEQALSLLCEKYPENRKKIKILNVGCGRKSQMSFLETLGFESFGIDFDIKEDTANIKFHDLNTQDNIPFENETFDCVICQEIIEHLENPWLLMRKVKKVLKVGGILILTTPNICSNQSKDIFCNNTNGFFIYFDPVNLWQHINPIPYWEMRHILTYNGFSIKKISGANEYYLNYIPNEENPSEQIRNEFSIQNNNVIIYLCENNHNNIKLYCPIPTYNYVWGK
jgi:SAM-dependent methyltransferase